MALQLYHCIKPSGKDTNAKWASKSVNELLWEPYTEILETLFKKKEAKRDVLFRTAVETDLEEMLFTSEKPMEQILVDTIKDLIKVQRSGTSLETTFSRTFINRSACVARHLQALSTHEFIQKTKKRTKSKKKEDESTPIVSIAIRSGLAFFMHLLKRSTRIVGAEDLLTDMLESMNEILLSFEPLALYNTPPPLLGEQSLDKASQFIRSCVTDDVCEENRNLAMNLLCNLALQRGTISSLLNLILFLMNLEPTTKIALSGFRPLVNYLISRRREVLDSFKNEEQEADEPAPEGEPQNVTPALDDTPVVNVVDSMLRADDAIEPLDSTTSNKPDSVGEGEIKDEQEENERTDDAKEKTGNGAEGNKNETEEKEDEELLEIFKNEELGNLLVAIEGQSDQISLGELVYLLFGLSRDIAVGAVTPAKKAAALPMGTKHVDEVVCFAVGNDDYDQIEGNYNTPTRQPSFCARKALQIEAGSDCSFILDEDGDIWSRGKGDYGRLGTGNTTNISYFQKVNCSVKFSRIAVSKESYGHGLAIDENGHIWSWGDGDYGKLGHGDTSQCTSPRMIDALLSYEIVSISCGNTFSAAATSDGKCFTWGGQSLGTGNSDVDVPTEVLQNIGGVDVQSVHCGRCHMFIIGDNGASVYGWGGNTYSEVGAFSETAYPCHIELSGIKHIEAGTHHTIALSTAGIVYGWGMGGPSGCANECGEPTQMESLSNITCIACGDDRSYAVDSNNAVYEWGYGTHIPTEISQLEGQEIQNITMGNSHGLFYNISPFYASNTSSGIVPIERSPFIIELNENTFSVLQDSLQLLHGKPEGPEQSQHYLLECVLQLLRSNLFHLRATGTHIENLEIQEIRNILLHILNNTSLSHAIKSACRSIFQESWDLLIPSIEMQSSVLKALLPSSVEKMIEFNDTEGFLLGVIVSVITKTSEYATLLHLPPLKEQNTPELSLDAPLWELITQLVDFLQFSTLKTLESQSGADSIFRQVIVPLESLLGYFNERVLAHMAEDSDATKLIGPMHVIKLLESAKEIVSSCSVREVYTKEESEELLALLKASHLGNLVPYCVTALHFMNNSILEDVIPTCVELLSVLDQVIKSQFACFLGEWEDEEFNGGDNDSQVTSSTSWLLQLERMLASLIGEHYSRTIIPCSGLTDEQKKLFTSELFAGGLIPAKEDLSLSGDSLLYALADGLPEADNLFQRLENVAKDKLLQIGTDDYLPLKSLICCVAAVMIKFLNLENVAKRVNNNINARVPPHFSSMIESTYLLGEQIVNHLHALNLDVSLSGEFSASELLEKENKELEVLCAPYIQRARFLLDSVAIKPPKSESEQFTSAESPVSGLRASVPISSPLRDDGESKADRSLDDSAVSPSSSPLSSHQLIRRVSSVARTLRYYQSSKDTHSIRQEIIDFLKGDQNISELQKLGQEHGKRAATRLSSLLRLTQLVEQNGWIPSVQLLLIKGTFQLLFKGYTETKTLNNDISLATVTTREQILAATRNLYEVLLVRIERMSSELLQSEGDVLLREQSILTTLLRAITSPLIRIYVRSFVAQEAKVDIILILFNILTNEKSAKFHPSLARAATRLFKCIIGAIGLKEENKELPGNVFTFYQKMLTSFYEQRHSVGHLLDHLLRSAVSVPFRQQLTSVDWLENTIFPVAKQATFLDQIMALRLLDTVLPHLPFAPNMQRYATITRLCFSLLAQYLAQPETKLREEKEYPITIDPERSLGNYRKEDGGTHILATEEDKEPEQVVIAFTPLKNVLGKQVCAFAVDINGECKPHKLRFGVANTTAKADEFLASMEIEITNTVHLAIKIVRYGENCSYVKFAIGTQESFNDIYRYELGDCSTMGIKFLTQEVSFGCSPLVLISDEMSHWFRFPLSSYSVSGGATLAQEITELFYSLHDTAEWTDFINSFLREAIAPSKVGNNASQVLEALSMISGVYSGLRTAGFVDFSTGCGTLQQIRSSDRCVSVFSNFGVNTFDDCFTMKPLIRKCLQINKLPLDEAFVQAVSSYIAPTTKEMTIEAMDIAVRATKACALLLTSEKCRSFVPTSLEPAFFQLVDIASTESSLLAEWPVEHLERMILNLKTALAMEDPHNKAEKLSLSWVFDKIEEENRKEEEEKVEVHSEEDVSVAAEKQEQEESQLTSSEQSVPFIESSEENESPINDTVEENLESLEAHILSEDSSDNELIPESLSEDGLGLFYSEYSGSSDDGSASIDSDMFHELDSKKSANKEVTRSEVFRKYFVPTTAESVVNHSSTLLLEKAREAPFRVAVRNTNKSNKLRADSQYVTQFAEALSQLSSEAKRTALVELQKHYQIVCARDAVSQLLLHPPATWKIENETCLSKIFRIIAIADQFPSTDIFFEKILRTVSQLHENAKQCFQDSLKGYVQAKFNRCVHSDKELGAISAVLPIIEYSAVFLSDVNWSRCVVDWMSAIILVSSFTDAQRLVAINVIARLCSEAQRNGVPYTDLFAGEFGELFVANLPAILSTQRKFDTLSALTTACSPFSSCLASIGYMLKDFACSSCTGSKWIWLERYFVTLSATEAFSTKKPVPKALSVATLKKEESGIAPYEDNERWTVEMDKNLMDWQRVSPEDWREPVIVFAWGKATEGQLGTLASSDVTKPRISNEFGRLADAVCGGERCSFVRTEEGNLYSTGLGDYGRLGTGNDANQRELVPLNIEGGAQFVSMHSSRGSYGSTMALSTAGHLYSWGDGDYGKLGHGDRNQRPCPTRIVALQNQEIHCYYCGPTHSAAVTKEGVLYTWGNGDNNRLGHGDSIYYESPKMVSGLEQVKVMGVACGTNHSMVIAEHGTSVWSWGCNDYGQLGNGTTSQTNYPTMIEIPVSHSPFISVEAGDDFSALLTKDGKVYTCGRGELGVLGIEDIADTLVPTQVTAIDSQFVIQIQAGYTHMLVLTNDGKVFTWGNNDSGELGLGHTTTSYLPEQVTFPGNTVKLTHISAGCHHNFAYAHLTDLSQLVPSKLPDMYSCLSKVFGAEMICRGRILSKYSDFFFSSYQLFNLDPKDGNTFGIENEVWRLKNEDKHRLLREYITHTGNSEDHGPTIALNRWTSGRSASLFIQACEKLKDVSPKSLMAKRAWRVDFLGEGSIDAGGPYNESISVMCNELQSGKVPILQPTPNALNKVGNNQDAVFPVANCKKGVLFRFLGTLFGISIRTHIPLSLHLPRCFWKLLLGQDMKPEDLAEIDESFVSSHKCLLRLEEDGVTSETFHALPLETFPPIAINGRGVELTFGNRKTYVKHAFAKRLHEWDYAIGEIQRGLQNFLPVSLLRLFSPEDLGVLVCGQPDVNWDLLQSCTKYSGDYSEDSEVIIWLWEVLRGFSAEDGSLFLRFAWGKARLPHSVSDFSHNFEVSQAPGGDGTLPTSATCFFKISLPVYSSKEILEEKLLYAVRNCTTIDTDNNAAPVYFSESDSSEVD